ncbi:MAG: Hpt domain-containing protein [bacterium]|nr:Hpt domain-containing protein [bacterium]
MNPPQGTPATEQVDLGAALDALAGSRELLCDLGQMFLEDAPEILGQLRQAVDVQDAEACHRLTHSLKGLASTFFAEQTVEQARLLEGQAATGNLVALSDGGVDRLEALVSELIAELKAKRLTNEV